MGRRVFVFIVGGATRSEVSIYLYFLGYYRNWEFYDKHISRSFQLRVCHKLTNKLKREIVLGSSSLDDPPQFITVSNFPIYKLKSILWTSIDIEKCFILNLQKLKLLTADDLSLDDLEI